MKRIDPTREVTWLRTHDLFTFSLVSSLGLDGDGHVWRLGRDREHGQHRPRLVYARAEHSLPHQAWSFTFSSLRFYPPSRKTVRLRRRLWLETAAAAAASFTTVRFSFGAAPHNIGIARSSGWGLGVLVFR